MPRLRRISAPAPLDRISGTTPRMKASEVIRIGRMRSRLASTAASAPRPAPAWCSTSANSTIRMAFLHASPMSTISPIWT